MSDTLARLAHKHGVDVVYDAAKEWCTFVEGQKAIMAKYGMANENLAERHQRHYQTCNCLADKATCCDPACPCQPALIDGFVSHSEGETSEQTGGSSDD